MLPKVVFVLMLAFRPDPDRAPGLVTVYETQAECLRAAGVKRAGLDDPNLFDAFCVEYSKGEK